MRPARPQAAAPQPTSAVCDLVVLTELEVTMSLRNVIYPKLSVPTAPPLIEDSRALAQIEANVATEAQKFVDQNTAAEAAFTYWDTVDGYQGYKNYTAILDHVVRVMIPGFNALIAKIPATTNISSAIAQAQEAIDHIHTRFALFPNFKPLPPDSASFPHVSYGSGDKQYGDDKIIAALAEVANAYNHRTGKKLLIGNVQWEHGGHMPPDEFNFVCSTFLKEGRLTTVYLDTSDTTRVMSWTQENKTVG
jgi:hypothetical protein